MPLLLLTLTTESDQADLALEFDDRTTVAHVAEWLAHDLGHRDHAALTIERLSRTGANFERQERLAHIDLRSGDVIRLTRDTGLRGHRPLAQAATLHVVEGADQGRSWPLARGETDVGRSSVCDIVLSDKATSRRHVRFIVSDVIEVSDLGSTNGVQVNGETISGPCRVRHGERVGIGDSVLVVDHTESVAPELVEAGNTVDFNRPPRVGRPYLGVKVEVPAPPDRPAKQRIPKIAAVVPVFMGLGLYFLTRNIASVAFVAMSPVLLLGNWYENKRSGRAEFKERLEQHQSDVERLVAMLDDERQIEYESRCTAAPHVDQLRGAVDQLSARLWERQPRDDDFLDLRIGMAPQPSRSTVQLGDGGARDLREQLQEIPAKYAMLPPVPITVSLVEVGALGVAGPPTLAAALARSIVAQAATLHSPSELVVAAMLDEEHADEWSWLKWLPHTRSPQSPLNGSHLAGGLDANLALLDEITRLITSRTPESPSSENIVHEPQILLLVDDEIRLERARLVPLLENGPRAGVSLVWVGTTTRRLPKACGAVADIAPSSEIVTIGWVDRQETIDDATMEGLSADEAADLARKLAPIVDVSGRVSADVDVPRSAPLVDLLGGPSIMDGPQMVLDRWNELATAATTRSLRGPVGATGTGVFSLDLRHDGPHGLVAGTSGSGKSEFLQSMLIGLAATHPPSRVTFLLIDYKGGSAFKECVKLPHTVGLVTDLTPALVKRALTSLRAELHRRERLLGVADAKDLIEMENNGHPDTPPSLLIVVDEFAALAREVPEFVDGVVDVAQRGRSLGLHLVLATQRPAGVVTDNIRANTGLRIALRVASNDESDDVIGSTNAANIDRTIPGRAFARLGPSELISFQSGYVGGHTSAADDAPLLAIGDFELGGIRGRAAGRRPTTKEPGRTDLQRMVATVNLAFDASGESPPRRPWLDPLMPAYDLLRLPRSTNDSRIVMGVTDDPAAQWQTVSYFEPDKDGSMLIFGAGGSGKSVALRTLAASASLAAATTPVHIHAADFAGRGLDMLEQLPTVGSVIPGEDYERLTKLLKMLRAIIDERSVTFAAVRASSLTEFRDTEGHAATPRVLVFLDGYENFQAMYERIDRGEWLELVPRLVADGRQFGVHFVLTGGRRTAFPLTLATTIGRKLVLRLANPDEYLALGLDAKLMDGNEPAGRGVDGDSTMQVAIAGTDLTTHGQAESLRQLGRTLGTSVTPTPPVQVLPASLSFDALHRSPAGLTIGLDDDLGSLVLPLGAPVLVCGPPRSGKSTAAVTIARAATQLGLPVALLSATGRLGAQPAVPVIAGIDAIRAFLPSVTPQTVLVIDDLTELADTDVELPLQELLSTPDRSVYATADSGQARRSYSGLTTTLKSGRRTLLLMPDVDLDGDLANTPLPRTSRKFHPGRGFYSDGGQLRVVQVGI